MNGPATIHADDVGIVDGSGEEKKAASVQGNYMRICGQTCGGYKKSVEKNMGLGCKACRGAPDAWANEGADEDGRHVAAAKSLTVKQLSLRTEPHFVKLEGTSCKCVRKFCVAFAKRRAT